MKLIQCDRRNIVLYFLVIIALVGSVCFARNYYIFEAFPTKGYNKYTNLNKKHKNSLEMEFVYINPGEFTMGSTKSQIRKVLYKFGEGDAVSRDYLTTYQLEFPAHRVKITKGYFICTAEVTVGQFKQFLKESGYRTLAEKQDKIGKTWTWDKEVSKWVIRNELSWKNPGWVINDNQPVVYVSWYDANAFAEWLSKNEGSHYRLPTEAEWEFAARGGLESKLYPWGDDWPKDNLLNLSDRSSGEIWSYSELDDGYKFVSEVGSYKPNLFGLYDMAGNVWEWTSDFLETYPNKRVINPTNRAEVTDSSNVVMRGGCFLGRPGDNRVTSRMTHPPADRTLDIGFRLVLDQ